MPPKTRQKNDEAAEDNSESSTAEDAPSTSNLQELQAKIGVREPEGRHPQVEGRPLE